MRVRFPAVIAVNCVDFAPRRLQLDRSSLLMNKADYFTWFNLTVCPQRGHQKIPLAFSRTHNRQSEQKFRRPFGDL